MEKEDSVKWTEVEEILQKAEKKELIDLSLCQNHLKCFKFQIKALNSIFS